MSRCASTSDEGGFILIGAIWLLVLAGGIVALLMLRAASAAEEADSGGKLLMSRTAMHSAAETVIADRLFYGPRSRWWQLPAAGTIAISGQAVTVKVTSEDARANLNDGTPEAIDDALRGLGQDGRTRGAVAAALAKLRSEKQRLDSIDDAALLFASAGVPRSVCWQDAFTLSSGRAQPVTGTELVASAAGGVARVTASTGGHSESWIARLASSAAAPVSIGDVLEGSGCSSP